MHTMHTIAYQNIQVSVIIINWNGGRFIERCLLALLNQTVKPHEIILVDNASSDGSIEIVQQFPLVRLIALGCNVGFARGNNLAIEAVSKESEWIALLNPDAFPEPDWLAQLMDAAQQHPDYTCFGSRQLVAGSEHLLDGDGDAYHISGLVWRNGHGKRKDEAVHEPREIFSPCAAAALYRRDALVEAGGFDEDFFCYVEDIDLGFRLQLLGHRCLLVPGAVVHHLGSATTGGQKGDFAVYHGHRNLVWCYVKNMPGILFWLLLPLHLAMNLVTVCVFILRGQGRVILMAKRDALWGLPKMWRKRAILQAKRTVSPGEIWRMLDKRAWKYKQC